MIAATLKAQRGKGGGGIGPEETLVTAFHQTQEPIHGDDFSPALGRTSMGMGIAGTVRSHTRPGSNTSTDIVDGAAVRRLTPVECERLQGLPDNWTLVPDNAPDSRRYAGLGDAVTEPVGYWIGNRILAAEAAA